MHDDIIRYSMTGTMDSQSNIVKQRDNMIHFLHMRMKEDGVSPSIDIDPQFTVDYDKKNDTREFVLSVYGIHVGGGKVWEIDGVMNGKTVPSIRKAKLSLS
jgi:hypothetical protein